MIVFEEQLGRIIELLPSITDAKSNVFPMNYNWGTIEVLNKYLLLPTNESKYPLIWLSTGSDENDLREPSVTRKARIIIATRSLNESELNPFQYQNDFSVILQPIVDNLLIGLSLSGISRYDDSNFNSERVPNYSVTYRKDLEDKTKASQIDIWNAIVLDLNITFFNTSNCVRENIF